MIELGINLTAPLPDDGGQTIGDQQVGPDRAVAVLGAHGEPPQALVGQDLLEDLHRVDRTARLELDFGQEESRPQPVGVGPADRAAASRPDAASSYRFARRRRQRPLRRRNWWSRAVSARATPSTVSG